MLQKYTLILGIFIVLLFACGTSKQGASSKLDKTQKEAIELALQKGFAFITGEQLAEGSWAMQKGLGEEMANEQPQVGVTSTVNVLHSLQNTSFAKEDAVSRALKFVGRSSAFGELAWSREGNTAAVDLNETYLKYCYLPPDIHSTSYALLADGEGAKAKKFYNEILISNRNTEVPLFNYFMVNNIGGSYCDLSGWRTISIYENLKLMDMLSSYSIMDTALQTSLMDIAQSNSYWANDNNYDSPYYFAYLVSHLNDKSLRSAFWKSLGPVLDNLQVESLSSADLTFAVVAYTKYQHDKEGAGDKMPLLLTQLLATQKADGAWPLSPYFFSRKDYGSEEKEALWLASKKNDLFNYMRGKQVGSLSSFELISAIAMVSYGAESNAQLPKELFQLLEEACRRNTDLGMKLPKSLTGFCEANETQRGKMANQVMADLAELVKPYYYGSEAENTALAMEALSAIEKFYAK